MKNCQKIQQKCPHAVAYAGGRRCAGGAGRCARALAGGCVRVRRGARHPLRYGGGIGQVAGVSRCRASGRRVLAGGEGCGAVRSGRLAGVRVSILYGMGGRRHRGRRWQGVKVEQGGGGVSLPGAGASGRRYKASGPPICQGGHAVTGAICPGRRAVLSYMVWGGRRRGWHLAGRGRGHRVRGGRFLPGSDGIGAAIRAGRASIPPAAAPPFRAQVLHRGGVSRSSGHGFRGGCSSTAGGAGVYSYTVSSAQKKAGRAAWPVLPSFCQSFPVSVSSGAGGV